MILGDVLQKHEKIAKSWKSYNYVEWVKHYSSTIGTP